MVSKQAQETCEQNISASKARVLLHSHDWEIKKIVTALKLPEITQNSAKESECLICFMNSDVCLSMVAHGRLVTSSRQITEVKQRRARFVLGWVTDGRVTLSAMCRGVGQAFHIMPPLSTQQWWVPGGTNNGELWMAIAAENALNSPQRRWDRTRESSNTGGVNCEVCWTRWDIRL